MKGKNIGKIIKSVAVIYGAIAVLGCFVAAIACYSNAGYHFEQEAVLSIWGNVLMFGGTIGNAIFALLMYGFGELIIYAKTIADNTAEILKK